MNSQSQRKLQWLRARFNLWLPWLVRATGAQVTMHPTGQGAYFRVTAKWGGGEYTMTVDDNFLRTVGRTGCTKDYARRFIQEVLKMRGVM